MTTTIANTISKINQNTEGFLPLNGTDYVEFYVSNAKQAAYFYQAAFGFQAMAYAGLETGLRDRESYMVQQGKIRLVLTSPLKSGTEIGKHIDKHGDAIKVIALAVDDAEYAYNATVNRGAQSFFEPITEGDDFGKVKRAGIHTYGDTVHVFVERTDYKGVFLPHFKAWKSPYQPKNIGLKYIDHIVGNVEWGKMNAWVSFYTNVMDFTQIISFDDTDISTEYTALMSKVVANGNGRIKFPLNEPAKGLKKSQIEEYLDFYEGAGIQHLALTTDDIISTVIQLRERGIEFLSVPDTYYEDLIARIGHIEEDIDQLKALNILVDRNEDGYLLQIFTKPLEPRPTLFFEIIQRKGATSFGKGNFKALFESIEREQLLRGTL